MGGLPRNTIQKLNQNAGTVPSSAQGVAAIIAPCSGGAANTNAAVSWSSPALFQATCLAGPAVEFAAYEMGVANLPIVHVKPTTSTAGKYTGPRMTTSTVLSVANGPPAALTTSAPHLLQTGDVVTITGGTGDTAINGTWPVTVTGASTFTIPVTGSGSYTASSATVTPTGLSYIGTGTAVPSPGSAAAIADDYNAQVTATVASPIPVSSLAGVVVYITNGGTLGTAGITYVYSLDGGNSVSAPLALGTALTLSLTEPVTGADSGVRITLGVSTATLVTGDYLSFQTVGPRMTSGDLTSALAALTATKLGFDLVLVHGETSSTFIAALEAWVLAMNATGRYPTVLVNTRFKNQTQAETETAYATALTTVISGVVANDVCCGADGAAYVSPLTGVTKAMPTSLYILARAESNALGVDPAETDLGPVPNADLDNPRLTAAFHDENTSNTLDTPGGTLNLSTLRSYFDRSGAFITNAYLLSSNGSDYVYLQHNRTMNAACALVNSLMTSLLSKGIPRNLKTSTILEPTAQAWEHVVQERLNTLLAGQVTGTIFSISRNDVFSGNGPQTIHYTLENDALAYVKNFAGVAEFVTNIV